MAALKVLLASYSPAALRTTTTTTTTNNSYAFIMKAYELFFYLKFSKFFFKKFDEEELRKFYKIINRIIDR